MTYACSPFGPINLEVINSAIAQIQGLTLGFPKANVPGIQAIDACGLLQTTVNEQIAQLNLYICGINAQNQLLAPYLALINAPANPTQAVAWISNFITTVLVPQYSAYLVYAEQAALLVAKTESLITAIVETEANINNCSITIPPIIPIVP